MTDEKPAHGPISRGEAERPRYSSNFSDLWEQPAFQALKARNISAWAEGPGNGMAKGPTFLPEAGVQRGATELLSWV